MPEVRRRWRTGAIIMAALSAVHPGPANAQVSDSAGASSGIVQDDQVTAGAYRLVYDHLSGEAVVLDGRGKQIRPSANGARWKLLDTQRGVMPLTQLPPDRPLVVEIQNANPLLFTYEVDTVLVRRRGVRPCRAVGESFVQRGFLLGAGAVIGLVPAPPDIDDAFQQSITASDFLKYATDGLVAGRGDSAGLTPETAARRLDLLRPRLVEFLAFADDIDHLARSLPDTLEAFAEEGESVPIARLVGDLRRRLNARTAGLGVARDVPRIARQRRDAVGAEIGNLVVLVREVQSDAYEGDVTAVPATEILELGARTDSALAAFTGAYRQLQVELYRLERAEAGTTQTFVVAPSGDDRRVIIRLRPTPEYPGIVRFRPAEVSVQTQPVVGVACNIAVGFAFMDHSASYEARSGRVADSSNEDIRAAPAVMLHVSPVRLGLGPLLGIGIGTRRRPDWYAGLGLRAWGSALVHAGVVWQRGQRLPDGLRVGDDVPDPSILEDLSLGYRAGWFAGLSIIPWE